MPSVRVDVNQELKCTKKVGRWVGGGGGGGGGGVGGYARAGLVAGCGWCGGWGFGG